MKRARTSLVLGVVTAALAAAAPASAARFCVADAACVTSGGTTHPTLQSAFDAATTNGFGLDQIEIGVTTLAQGGIVSSPVEVIGEGQAQTTVGGSTATIISLLDPASSIRDLTVQLDGSDDGGIGTSGAITRVTVTGASDETETGIVMDGGTGRDLTVSLPLFPDSAGIRLAGGATIEDATVTAVSGIATAGEGEVVRDVRIEAGNVGFQGGITAAGPTTLETASIRLRGPGAGISGAPPFFGGTSTTTARHVTVVGAGQGAGAAAGGACDSAGAIASNLVLRNVIVNGFEHDLSVLGESTCTAAGSIDVAYSLFDPGRVQDSGPGEIIAGPGNVGESPRFADLAAGDLHLTSGSPAIDAGDPAGLAAGEPASDLDGNPRIVDGDSDGIAIRDMGAFEASIGTSPRGFDRKLKLSYSAKRGIFKGKIKTPGAPCRKGKVRVYLKEKRGADSLVGAKRTSSKGKFSVRDDAEEGTYYATVRASESDVARCGEARSKALNVG